MKSSCVRTAARGVARLLPLCCLALAGAAGAEGIFALPDFSDAAWRPLTFPRIERHTSYTLAQQGSDATMAATSDCSASALVAPVPGLDLERTPRLSWRWKVERPVEARSGEREKGGDDFAARVYVAFRFDPAKASTWERLKRRAAERIYGTELPGNALNYVWARNEPAGASWDNPYTASSRMLSLGRGALRGWREQTVDVLEDYRKSFGSDPPPVMFVGIMSDSDDSCSQAAASFADFRFLEH